MVAKTLFILFLLHMCGQYKQKKNKPCIVCFLSLIRMDIAQNASYTFTAEHKHKITLK